MRMDVDVGAAVAGVAASNMSLAVVPGLLAEIEFDVGGLLWTAPTVGYLSARIVADLPPSNPPTTNSSF